MIAAIIAALTFLGQILSLANKIWDAHKEKDEEVKNIKTAALQIGLQAIVDKDKSKLTAAFDTINNASK